MIILFVPSVNSFLRKIQIKKFYQIGSKRIYNLGEDAGNDFAIYINRIKNLN